MKINKWKVVAYTLISWFGISLLAKLYLMGMLYPPVSAGPNYGIVDADATIWGLACFIMGIVSSVRLKRWTNIGWGILFSVISVIPIIGVFTGIFYFAWSFVKFERRKMLVNSSDYEVEKPNSETAAKIMGFLVGTLSFINYALMFVLYIWGIVIAWRIDHVVGLIITMFLPIVSTIYWYIIGVIHIGFVGSWFTLLGTIDISIIVVTLLLMIIAHQMFKVRESIGM